MALGPIVYVWVERKVAGLIQDRLGPTRVGPYGLLQTVADAIKLMFKEAIFPAGADKMLFLIAPCLVVLGAFMAFGRDPVRVAACRPPTSTSASSTWWPSPACPRSGWSWRAGPPTTSARCFGAMRAAAQIVSYEIPAVMILLVHRDVRGQPLAAGHRATRRRAACPAGSCSATSRSCPCAFVIFFTAGLAECNRAPFDLPEAESELVAGFHTEYSGFFFAMFFMAEYAEMFVISAVASVLFLGGWYSPFPSGILSRSGPIGLGPVWLIAKALFLVFIMMWLRWTLPRLRVDQLMYVAWKVLLPISMVHRGGGGRAHHVGAHPLRLPLGPVRGVAPHAARAGRPDPLDGGSAPLPQAPGPADGGLRDPR